MQSPHRVDLLAPRIHASHQPRQQLRRAVAALGQAGKQLGRLVPGARGEAREQLGDLVAAGSKAAQQLLQLVAGEGRACRAGARGAARGVQWVARWAR